MEAYQEGFFITKNIGKTFGRKYERHPFDRSAYKDNPLGDGFLYLAIHKQVLIIDFYMYVEDITSPGTYVGKIIGDSEMYYKITKFFGMKQ